MLIRVGADNLISLTGLKNQATGAFVNDAVVTFTLKDKTATAVSGATTVSMPYVTASSGNYQGVLAAAVALVENATYWLEITATKAANVDFRRIRCAAVYRTEE